MISIGFIYFFYYYYCCLDLQWKMRHTPVAIVSSTSVVHIQVVISIWSNCKYRTYSSNDVLWKNMYTFWLFGVLNFRKMVGKKCFYWLNDRIVFGRCELWYIQWKLRTKIWKNELKEENKWVTMMNFESNDKSGVKRCKNIDECRIKFINPKRMWCI